MSAGFTSGRLTANGSSSVVSGLGFAPKAVYMFHSSKPATGTDTSSYYYQQGLGTTAFQGNFQSNEADNITPTAIARSFTATRVITDGGTVVALLSFQAGGFTLTWTGGTPGTTIFWVAVGGTDVSASSGSLTLPTVGATTSVSGLGFQPTALLFVHRGSAAAGDGVHGTGITDGTNQQAWATLDTNASAAPVVTTSLTSSGVIVGPGAGPDYKASLASLDADGFTLTMNVNPAAADVTVYWLAFGGFTAEVGRYTQPAAGAQSVGVSFRPGALLSWPSPLTADASGTAGNACMTAGIVSASGGQGCIAEATDNGGLRSNCCRGVQTSGLNYVINAAGASAAFCNTATLTSAGLDLNWSASDGTARAIPYLAFPVSRLGHLLPVLGVGT